MTEKRSVGSWSISIILHGLLAVFVIRAGYKVAFPEGNVETVTIGTFGSAPAAAAPAIQAATKAVADVNPPIVATPKVFKPVFLPDKSAEKIHAASKVETQEESPVVIPAEQPVEEPTHVAEEAAVEKEETTPEPVPTATPIEAATPPTAENVTEEKNPDPAHVTESPVASKSDAAEKPGTSDGIKTPIPVYGTPGTTIQENQVTEKYGNRTPNYPWMSRLRRQQGTVVVRAYINKDGLVQSAAVQQSSGSPLLDKEALEKFTQYKYKPGKQGWLDKPFKFSLVDAVKK